MNEPQGNIYEFDEFRVDAAKRLLLKDDDETIPLMPKAFDTLLYLVQNHGKVIEKDELMREIWTDTIVEENNLTQNISSCAAFSAKSPAKTALSPPFRAKDINLSPKSEKLRKLKRERNRESKTCRFGFCI